MQTFKKHTCAAAVLVLLLSMGACQPKNEQQTDDKATHESFVDHHNSRNSLDWAGTYEGTLPCADCPGIETILTLSGDNTYTLSERYLKGDQKPNESSGTLEWDKDGNRIIISKDGRRFKVEEGRVLHLDLEGNIITGELKEYYILKKTK
jgi:uncharacterized lipoprotein NlpE involved in copper resistance